jgi:hypothetical protein
MVFLDGNPVYHINKFGNRFQAILSMIPGGTEWLLWAMQDRIMPPCTVKVESELLELIQQGLHADGYIRFITFRAQLRKILTLSEEDIEWLSNVRGTSDDTDKFLQNLLGRYNLLSYEDLENVKVFTANDNITRKDLFQSLSFSDKLSLSAFSRSLISMPVVAKSRKTASSVNPDVNKKTASSVNPDVNKKTTDTYAFVFAQQPQTATVGEFIDLFAFYKTVSKTIASENVTLQVQDNEIRNYYTQLQSLVNYLLYTPCVGAGYSERAIRYGLKELAESNRFVGYITGASAVRNLAENINFSNLNASTLQEQIESYLSAIRAAIISTPATKGVISQDGGLITYRIENHNALVFVGADSSGNIFLLPGTTIKTSTLNNNNNTNDNE